MVPRRGLAGCPPEYLISLIFLLAACLVCTTLVYQGQADRRGAGSSAFVTELDARSARPRTSDTMRRRTHWRLWSDR
jgi:hypothetical protein